jgi:hypothetical protein
LHLDKEALACSLALTSTLRKLDLLIGVKGPGLRSFDCRCWRTVTPPLYHRNDIRCVVGMSLLDGTRDCSQSLWGRLPRRKVLLCASDLRGFVGWYSVVGAVLERSSAAPQTLLLRQPRIILGVFVAMSCSMSVGWSVGICW